MSKYHKGDLFILELGSDGRPDASVEQHTVYVIKTLTPGIHFVAYIAESVLDELAPLQRTNKPIKPTIEPFCPYRSREVLLQEPDDMTLEEKERLERIKSIPDDVVNTVQDRISELTDCVKATEKERDTLIDFLNGEIIKQGGK